MINLDQKAKKEIEVLLSNTKMSKAQKIWELYLMGLTTSDIAYYDKRRYFETFGVEIECIVKKEDILKWAYIAGLNVRYEDYNHFDSETYWRFVPDSSVEDRNGSKTNAIECVSPPLASSTGFEQLKVCCDMLDFSSATVNKTCGLHVHIGMDGMSDEAFVAVFKNYQYLEDLIDSFMPFSRRGNNNTYAMSIKDIRLDDCKDPEDIMDRLDDRYFKVNPWSSERHGTIEFRQHSGTTDYQKISAWVRFCAGLVSWSKSNLFQRRVDSLADVPFISMEDRLFFKSRIELFARQNRAAA